MMHANEISKDGLSLSSKTMIPYLHTLLQRARQLKPETTIDPPLDVSKLANRFEDKPKWVLQPDGPRKEHGKHVIELAAKTCFYKIVCYKKVTDDDFVDVWNLLDILQYCGDRDECSPQLVLLLVEELLDTQTIAGCKVAFQYLESRREVLIANNSKNKDLVILRLCNELLRRLSRIEDAVFCGTVYIFLHQSFPLGDRSSVNLRGDFHVENVTTFDDYVKELADYAEQMDIDGLKVDDNLKVDQLDGMEAAIKKEEESKGATDKKAEKTPTEENPSRTLDLDTLYPRFWSLQKAFSNPVTLFDEAKFKEFQSGLEATLAKFKEVPKVTQTASKISGKSGVTGSLGDDHDQSVIAFNPKYLTSRDLFKLELSDLTFQRHILVQALMIIDFLFTLTEKAKSKPQYQNAQKAMQYPYTLSGKDAEWASGIKNAIANYLQEGPDGKFYYRMVDTVLSRDKNWVRWKMENCQPFTRDRVPTEDFAEAKSGAQKLSRSNQIPPPKEFGSILGFLSTSANEAMEKLKDPDRFPSRSAEPYAKEVERLHLDREMAASEEEKVRLDEEISAKTWMALRLAGKSELSKFDKLDPDLKNLGSLFQPDERKEDIGVEAMPAASDDRDKVPQEQHPSVEERRAG